MAILFLADGRLQAHRLLADFDDFTHLLSSDLHLCGNLFGRRFTPKVLQQTAADTNQAVNRLDHMHRNTNSAGLVSDGASDSLTNPPSGVCAKLVALGVVEFFDSTNQADI